MDSTNFHYMSTSAAIADSLRRRGFGRWACPSYPSHSVGHSRSRRSQSLEVRAPVSQHGSTISRRTVMSHA